MAEQLLPDDITHVRTTDRFDEASVPAGLLADHRLSTGTWAVLTVHSGALGFRFDDDGSVRRLEAGETQVIPPLLAHRLVVDGPVTFDLAFHRRSERQS